MPGFGLRTRICSRRSTMDAPTKLSNSQQRLKTLQKAYQDRNRPLAERESIRHLLRSARAAVKLRVRALMHSRKA